MQNVVSKILTTESGNMYDQVGFFQEWKVILTLKKVIVNHHFSTLEEKNDQFNKCRKKYLVKFDFRLWFKT